MINENFVYPHFKNSRIEHGLDSLRSKEIEVNINKHQVPSQGSHLSNARGFTPMNSEQQQRFGATFWQNRRGQSVDTHQKLEAIKRPATDNKSAIRINDPFLQPINFASELAGEKIELEPKL